MKFWLNLGKLFLLLYEFDNLGDCILNLEVVFMVESFKIILFLL